MDRLAASIDSCNDAYPWHASRYRDQVKSALGTRFDDNYRIWYNDHANHDYDEYAIPDYQTSQLVTFRGLIQYALLELADWAEQGTMPADSTNATISGVQVSVANTAAERHGIQPVATLTVNGAVKTVARVGETVTLNAHVEVPPGMSKIVAVEWDLVGTGDPVPYPLSSPASSLDLEVQTYYNDTG